jgi:hypothetical protein
MVKKDKLDYKKYFYISLGSFLGILLVAVVLSLLLLNSSGIIGQATRSTEETYLQKSVIPKSSSNDDALTVLRRCLCTENTCGSGEREPTEEIKPVYKCIDTDNGNNPRESGRTYIVDQDGNVVETKSDSCSKKVVGTQKTGGTVQTSTVPITSSVYVEYYCDNNRIASATAECKTLGMDTCSSDGTTCMKTPSISAPPVNTVNSDKLATPTATVKTTG